MSEVLIIIDMLNGFCRKGYPLSLKSSTKGIESYIKKRAKQIHKAGGRTIFICDDHKLSDPEINNPYPPHCIQGTHEAEIIDSLNDIATKSILLKKNTLSIFLNTKLEPSLKKIKPDAVEVAGVCTDICVLFAVYELRIRGYNVKVAGKGVLPLDPSKQADCLKYFKDRLGASIV